MTEWFYLATFTWTDRHGGTRIQQFTDVVEMQPKETQQDVYYRIQEAIIDEIGLDEFRSGHFLAYFVAKDEL